MKYKLFADCLRYLSAYMVFNAKGGHLSMPLGFADVMSVLATKFLRYNSSDPKWFNRDRLILSAGHGSALLYAFYYLAGYEDCSFEDLKNFRKFGAKASSHPEYGKFAATETTTGLLGQGFATSIGMAIAQKKYETFLGKESCNYKIYVIAGDGCLMEGISYEAASLAGHLRLNNLILLFDDNNVTSDGDISLSVSEDHLAKFKAMGWETESVDGHDHLQIENALERARNADKPYFIACRTIAGFGTNRHDHMGYVSEEELGILRDKISLRKDGQRFDDIEGEIGKLFVSYNNQYEASSFHENQKEYISFEVPDIKNISTRQAASICLQRIVDQNLLGEKFIIGSADLGKSTCVKLDSLKEITSTDFSGNYLNYGVREHAMGAIMNGIALSGMTAIGSTFLSFSDYMRPAIRMSALQKLPVIYLFTHDSIMIGEDGSTHQPIEHLDSLKLIPNLNVARPFDIHETKSCMELALNSDMPTIFALSRQEINNDCDKASDCFNISKNDFTIFASGSDVAIAYSVAGILASKGYKTHVVSIPFWSRDMNFDYYETKIKVAIETGTGIFWNKLVGNDGIIFCLKDFGIAGASKDVIEYFDFVAESIVEKLISQKTVQVNKIICNSY
jgi:transketolase